MDSSAIWWNAIWSVESTRSLDTKASKFATTSTAKDVARFIHAFIEVPRVAEVYNIGGGKANSCSILEAFRTVSYTHLTLPTKA